MYATPSHTPVPLNRREHSREGDNGVGNGNSSFLRRAPVKPVRTQRIKEESEEDRREYISRHSNPGFEQEVRKEIHNYV